MTWPNVSPGQSHCQAVEGHYEDTPGVLPDEFVEALPDFHRGVTVVGQGDDRSGRFSFAPQQVGDAVHQHPGLAGPWPGDDQDAGLDPVVADDVLLGPVVQVGDNPPEGLLGGLPLHLGFPVGQPFLEEVLLLHAEVVHGEPYGVGGGLQAAAGVLRHYVDLDSLGVVVVLQGLVVGVGEMAAFLLQPDGHGRGEDAEAPVEPDDLLVVQPEHRVVEPVVHRLPVASVGPVVSVLAPGQGLREVAPGGVDHEVLAPDSLGELGEEKLQDAVGVSSSSPRRRPQCGSSPAGG